MSAARSAGSSGDTVAETEHVAPMFVLDDVSCQLAGRTLLDAVSLTLSPRRVVGLIGHNGSGKSTLLKILARQLPASSGSVAFEGRALGQWSDRPFARRLAYMPQHTPPASGLKVRELVALGRYPWHGALGRFGKTDRDKVDEAIERTGIAAFGDRLVDTLSGGERQRVWIAMLVAQDAECLLLDEPISALDIAHQIEVLSLVRALGHSRGVVVVLHDVNMAARFCDEIVALRSGKLIARGTPREIVTPHRLREIYGVEMQVMPHPSGGYPVAIAD